MLRGALALSFLPSNSVLRGYGEPGSFSRVRGRWLIRHHTGQRTAASQIIPGVVEAGRGGGTAHTSSTRTHPREQRGMFSGGSRRLERRKHSDGGGRCAGSSGQPANRSVRSGGARRAHRSASPHFVPQPHPPIHVGSNRQRGMGGEQEHVPKKYATAPSSEIGGREGVWGWPASLSAARRFVLCSGVCGCY